MKRIAIVVTALGLVAGACGGDDEAESTPAPVEADATAGDDAPNEADDTESNTTEEPAEPDPVETTESSDGTDTGATDDDTAAADTDDESEAAGGRTIGSIDDIPRVCRDLMAEFLRDIEPTVSPIDWQNASLNELESVGQEFEARSDEFEAAGEPEGCNDLDFVADNEFELMIDFARTEAPGTVGFLEFVAQIGGLAEPDADDVGSGAETADGFASCDEAIEFVQGLIDDYDSLASVPASDLLRFQGLATVMISCTPEQLEFFDSPEINDFFGG